MKKVLKGFLSFGLAIAMCFGILAIEHSVTSEPNVAYAAEDSYYSGITATSGKALLGQVHDLITSTHKKYTSYDDCKKYGPTTDPGLDGKGALEFYTHETIMSFSGTVGTWNREHVWCQSLSNGMWGTSGGGSDMHHIRPSEASLNSTRGNNKYGMVTNGSAAYSKKVGGANSQLGGYVGGGAFEPLDNVKGDVARIVMYIYTHYNSYSNSIFGGYANTNGSGGNFGALNFTHVMSASNESAAISLLLEWNKKDPVDSIETFRNEEVYKVQGNRNPFIDHPEYADAIWGDGSVTPRPDEGTTVEPTGLTISPASVSLSVGQTKTLSVTVTPNNASKSVTWTTSNSSVATVSNGIVTAKAVGTAKITATCAANSNIKATATVTVTNTSSTVTSGSVVIDINSFTALSGSYGFQAWSSGEIGGTAYIYGGANTYMQFNSSKDTQYLASDKAAPAPIKEITVKLNSKTTANKDWRLLTSTTAYGEVTGNPKDGTDEGTKSVTTSGTTWTLSGNDTYFALIYEGSGACYLDSITVVYGGNDVGGGDVGGGEDGTNVSLFRNAVAQIVTSGSLEERLASINNAINAYRILTADEKASVADDVQSLQVAIDDYNKTVGVYNDEFGAVNGAVNGGAKR